ncbi:MAG TPA: ATP-binding protein [Acidobacteriaceae bacterium]|nr:ATP-binding protein [Acidobacteriaceae bacterium]
MRQLFPRSIRWQLIWGTALLQCLLVAAVFGYVYHEQRNSLRRRTMERLTYQANVLATIAGSELKDQKLARLQLILDGMVATPSIRAARITDMSGDTLAYSNEAGKTSYPPLSDAERRHLGPLTTASIFDDGRRGIVAAEAIEIDNVPIAVAWVYPDTAEDQVDLSSLLRSALLFALLAIAANALFSLLLARSVTRPLRGLLRGTKLLIRDPERSDVFPLKTRSRNEAGELTRSFNTMVAALKEQRAGLNETLALLDSMLANAPIGFAFFDRKMRYVRMNQFLAEMDQLSISHHLGRTVQEVFPGLVGTQLAAGIEHVFASGQPVRELEIHGELPTAPASPRIWLISLYPVRTGGDRPANSRAVAVTSNGGSALEPPPNSPSLRWVGAVIVDATERKLSEELLRRTEKLAATGQLAASIAHEINNPLEAVTNLLYLLDQQPLDEESRHYTDMAQQEIARVSQITQQTLRFYRQSSSPTLIQPADVLDSVLDLHHGRSNAAKVQTIRRYRDGAELYAFSGEMRQLFANFVGNALDAMPNGGKMYLSVRASQAWYQPEVQGVRITIADTGYGMTEAVRERIFEPFFTTKEITGTGLGLWISSEIIAKHQGTVKVRSRPAVAVAENDGTTDAGIASGNATTSAGKCSSGTVFMLFFPFNGLADSAVTEESE